MGKRAALAVILGALLATQPLTWATLGALAIASAVGALGTRI